MLLLAFITARIRRKPIMSHVPVREKESKEKPANKPSAVEAAVAETAEASGASVEKIRKILFGSQIKNYEARFARLEEALSRETAEIKDTMRRRLDSLEAFFKQETESLAARLKSERDEREETLNNISRELLDEIRQRNDSISALLESRVQELRNAKTDRSALAALFVELAVRLKDEGEDGKGRPKPIRSATEA